MSSRLMKYRSRPQYLPLDNILSKKLSSSLMPQEHLLLFLDLDAIGMMFSSGLYSEGFQISVFFFHRSASYCCFNRSEIPSKSRVELLCNCDVNNVGVGVVRAICDFFFEGFTIHKVATVACTNADILDLVPTAPYVRPTRARFGAKEVVPGEKVTAPSKNVNFARPKDYRIEPGVSDAALQVFFWFARVAHKESQVEHGHFPFI